MDGCSARGIANIFGSISTQLDKKQVKLNDNKTQKSQSQKEWVPLYYRVERIRREENILTPSSYWERVNDEKTGIELSLDRNLGEFDIFKSLIPEVCFSKTLGGCFASLFSSLVKSRTDLEVKEDRKCWYVYETEQPPCLDLSNFEHLDFAYTEEVRYKQEVHISLFGRLTLDDKACTFIQQIAKIGFERPWDLVYTTEQVSQQKTLITELNNHLYTIVSEQNDCKPKTEEIHA